MASTSHVRWDGSLTEGRGHIEVGSGALSADYTTAGRFEDAGGTTPEELIAAAHAACYSMAMALVLGEAGHELDNVETDARVYIRKQDDGIEIHKIELSTVASVAGLDDAAFAEIAETVKSVCPVSKALAGVGEITLEARLAS